MYSNQQKPSPNYVAAICCLSAAALALGNLAVLSLVSLAVAVAIEVHAHRTH